jgi:hypothetical protein
LEGVDAFEKLKAQAAKASIQHPPKALELPMPKIPDPAIARAALEVTAREGLPVKGVNAKGWEDLRPKIVHDTRPAKVCFSQAVLCRSLLMGMGGVLAQPCYMQLDSASPGRM